MDFLYNADRATRSDLLTRTNMTVPGNASYHVPNQPPADWPRASGINLAFVQLLAALVVFAVRYSAVFWFTNKTLAACVAVHLFSIAIQSLTAVSGLAVLYKLAVNAVVYTGQVRIVLDPTSVLVLYIISECLLLLSTVFVYAYCATCFQEQFDSVNKYNPDIHKLSIKTDGCCQGYRTHAYAMTSLVVLCALRAPLLYELVTLYRVTNDGFLLSCITVDVFYMLMSVLLWTVFTLKQRWKFQILDYVPRTQPLFITNNHLIKSASYDCGSAGLAMKCIRKRPSSVPGDVTCSKSIFDSLHDGRGRLKLSMSPLVEVSGISMKQRKGSTHSLDRKSRRLQRITFRETVKRSVSTDNTISCPNTNEDECFAFDVIQQRNSTATQTTQTAAQPASIVDFMSPRQMSLTQHSKGRDTMVTGVINLNNTSCRQHIPSAACDDGFKICNSSQERQTMSKTDRFDAGPHSPNNSNNTHTANAVVKTPTLSIDECVDDTSKATTVVDITGNKPCAGNFQTIGQANIVISRRPLAMVGERPVIGLCRRDSANYSMTSSQETASSESDQGRVYCSHV